MCTEVKSRLLDKLPHGSGINGKWYLETHKKHSNILFASNCLEAMNETGMYCHNYYFTVKVKYNGIGQYEPCPNCNETGYRTIAEMKNYHVNLSQDELIAFLLSRGIDTIIDDKFTCNYCNGFGKIPLHEFEFESLNFHGQREYSCCGYEMKSYISDTIAEYLTFDN
jgi:hypothetical protein